MNRDEDMKRPTNQAEWKDGILAGRDMEPGKGDWLKITLCWPLLVSNSKYIYLDIIEIKF